MATFPFETHSRENLPAMIIDTSLAAAESAGPQTLDLNIPTGMKLTTLALQASANKTAIVVTSVKPYIDRNHLMVGDAVFFSKSNTTVSVSTITIATTGAGVRGLYLTVYPNKFTATAAVPPPGVMSVYGFEVKISATAAGATGNWYLGALATGE